jgi:hypothetical protein
LIASYILLNSKLDNRQIIFLAVAYGLIVVQGVAVLRPIFGQSLQNIWILRVLISQSFFGVVLLTLLTLQVRARLNEGQLKTQKE